MIKVSLANMMKHVDSQYRLLRIAAMRTHQLTKGAKARVENVEGLKATTVALREIADGGVPYFVGEPPPPIEDDAADE